MQQNTSILNGHSELEKGAYLGAIASIATADRSANDEETEFIKALIDSAGLNEDQSKLILDAASTSMADEQLMRCLDVLKTSDLRFSLVSDVIAFAESDKNYSEEEKQHVKKIADYLHVNAEQFSLLDQFTKKAVEEVPKHAEEFESDQTTPSSFLDSLGFGDKLKSAGINTNSLLNGALGILGPIFLAKMFSRNRNTSNAGGTSNQGGGLLGGLLGGSNTSQQGGGLLGGLLGGGSSNTGGGLLSSILGNGGLLGGLLGGGKGFGNARGMLGRLFGGGR